MNDLREFAFRTKDKASISTCINKIMNLLSFRKLAGKTQVILSLSGPDVRTRLTHTIGVAKIARDICNKLGLNEDLAEAIALAHDIGHTPFGHVGERTLREIMCGCETLNNRVSDCDFENSGFKHNLQSFRVLSSTNLFNDKKTKPIELPILWGALTHSKMSWSKPYSGFEDEILISSKHCDWVYCCYFHEKKECKRNIQYKQKLKDTEKEKVENAIELKKICKPWYCAKLLTVNHEKYVKQPHYILDKATGETRREFVAKEYFRKKYSDYIYCSRKCFLARLWKYRIREKEVSSVFPFLFDHPFPNTFYAKELDSKIIKLNKKNWRDCITLEAQIVSQADEIAQRQQDLEDGIIKNLISLDDAIDELKKLIKPFKGAEECKKFSTITKPEELGKTLVDFYCEAIFNSTKRNIQLFTKLNNNRETINIYCLLNILYSIQPSSKNKSAWILKELKECKKNNISKVDFENNIIQKYFNLDFNKAYLFLVTYDYLEKLVKRFENWDLSIEILNQIISCLSLEKKQQKKLLFNLENKMNDLLKVKNTDAKVIAYNVIQILDDLSDYLWLNYKPQCKEFFLAKNKRFSKQMGAIRLPNLLLLSSIHKKYINRGKVVSASKLKSIKIGEVKEVNFGNWKKALGYDADKVLKNLVAFIPMDDSKGKREDKEKALENFESMQRDRILKSESVEKNDGKAGYILKRLFKAYITNSHQLPDIGLKYILNSTLESNNFKSLLESEENTFKKILSNLRKSVKSEEDADNKINQILGVNFLRTPNASLEALKDRTSNEIKAAIDKRIILYKFIKRINTHKRKIRNMLFSEKEEHIKDLQDILNKYRAVLDNPVLNATQFWKSLLTRGICDYIASLTDQEAINEYEKLYAGVMELT